MTARHSWRAWWRQLFAVMLKEGKQVTRDPSSWIIAVFQLRVASSVYWTSVTDGLYLDDAWMGIIKPFCLGYVIVTIGCHVGLRTSGGTQGVGRATTNAVVASSVAVIAVDFFVTRLLITLLY